MLELANVIIIDTDGVEYTEEEWFARDVAEFGYETAEYNRDMNVKWAMEDMSKDKPETVIQILDDK